MTVTDTMTKWHLKGKGYEFCNCAPGCTCNFAGFPSSPDGSCKAYVGNFIESGSCGDVDLSGVKAIGIFDWPKAIHDGGGKVVFVVEPETTDAQVDCLAKIYTGQLGGNPWTILGTTYEVAGLVKARISVEGSGLEVTLTAEGVAQGSGNHLKNPVTGEPHDVQIVLAEGFIWKKGDCGVGSFSVHTEGVNLEFKDSSWISYEFDWANDK